MGTVHVSLGMSLDGFVAGLPCCSATGSGCSTMWTRSV